MSLVLHPKPASFHGMAIDRAKPTAGDNTDSLPKASSPSNAIIAAPSMAAFEPGWRFYSLFATLCIIALAVALDATSLSVALPVCESSMLSQLSLALFLLISMVKIISQRLQGSATEAFWSGTSFLLASTVFQPTYTSLSHTFGRKPLFLSAIALFTLGAIVGALANNFTTLLVGRSIQGVGGGGIISLTEVIITDLVPLRDRGTWFGFQNMTWALGSVTGPLVGGAFAQAVSWRWIFWLNLPFCGIGIVAVPFFLRLNKRPGPFFAKFANVDWIGAFLLTASVTSFLMPVSWGGVLFSWSSWHTLVPLILGICGTVGFVSYENRFPREPLVRLGVFRQRTAMVNYFGTFIHGIVLWCLLYYLPLYYEAVQNYTPIVVGVAVFPETFTVAPASVVVGIAVSKTGRFRWAIWSGWLLTVLGMGLLYLLSPETSIPAWIFLNLAPGLGMGLLFSSMTCAIQAGVSQDDVAFAASTMTFIRAFGQAIGVAVGGVVFQSQLEINLNAYPSLARNASELSQHASSLVQTIKAMPKEDPERRMIVSAYADSLKVVWAVMAGLAFLALIASAWTEGLSLDQQLATEQGLRAEETKYDN